MAMIEKDQGQLCQEIHYQKTEKGILITGCYGVDAQVVLPDEIEGIRVNGIGDYAFAESERDRTGGSMVTEIRLPSQVTEIGRYAFYRCRNLKKLVLTDSLLEIGGGAFTGCNLSEVELYFQRGEQSCLKSILDEMRFAIRVKLFYPKEGTASLLFPEHYEEAVENTPARILFTQHHGAGGYYRQCFYDRKLDYKKYDELFFHTVVQEKPRIVAELALNRLRYPFRLTSNARKGYETYVREHLEAAADYLIGQEDVEGLRFLGAGGYWTEAALNYGISAAAERKETEILSILMDEKHKKFKRGRKKFEL